MMNNPHPISEYLVPGKRAHLVGIGGVSMCPLAEVLRGQGLQVQGSDMNESDTVRHLRDLGVHVAIGHNAENLGDCDLVIRTAAVHDSNPEIAGAVARGIPVYERAQAWGAIMQRYPNALCVAGTHGKTTTTSMVSEILLAAETDPTITVGGILPTIGSNLKIGHSPFFVAEACEYFDSFLQFQPMVGVILNVESDHLDYFKDLAHIRRSFHAFAQRVPAEGVVIINHEIDDVAELTAELNCAAETFGMQDGATWQAKNIVHENDGTNSFDVYYKGEFFGPIHLNVPGDHNIMNALASIASAHYLGIDAEDCRKGMLHFGGTDRRFQRKGEKNGIQVIDDYAHHPTEIKAALAAAKKVKHNTTWCVFQPHTYSRTKFLFDEFGESFGDADEIIIADIFGEQDQSGAGGKHGKTV